MTHSIADLYAEIFEIIDSCTFSSKRVTPTMWGVFELIYKAFKESGIDFMDGKRCLYAVRSNRLRQRVTILHSEMLPSLDNYISYGQDVFVTNQPIQGMMFDIIETVSSF
jgi:importin-7